jgi:hypothetical protein
MGGRVDILFIGELDCLLLIDWLIDCDVVKSNKSIYLSIKSTKQLDKMSWETRVGKLQSKSVNKLAFKYWPSRKRNKLSDMLVRNKLVQKY